MLWDEPKIFFLERRYFFSIILSEFLKNRVALHNTKLSLYTEYIGNTVNECEEYVWREMEKFRATYGDPTGKSEHFTSRFLNDGQKLKIISEMLQKMDWYQGDMEDEKDEE